MRLVLVQVLVVGVGCTEYHGVDSVPVVGGDEIVRMNIQGTLRMWDDHIVVSTALKSIRVLDSEEELPEGCSRDCYLPSQKMLVIISLNEDWWTNSMVLHEFGHAVDYGQWPHGRLSDASFWQRYSDEQHEYARPVERFAKTMQLGPTGLQLFYDHSRTCPSDPTMDDIDFLRREVIIPQALELQPAAPPTRIIRLPDTWQHMPPRLWGAEGLILSGEAWTTRPWWEEGVTDTREVAIVLPSLDEASPFAAPLVEYPPAADGMDRVESSMVHPSDWLYGLGGALLHPVPIASGETNLAGVWLDNEVDAFYSLYLALEYDPVSRRPVAVHDAFCGPTNFFHYFGTPVHFETEEGVWLVSFLEEEVHMRLFAKDGQQRAREVWALENIDLPFQQSQVALRRVE